MSRAAVATIHLANLQHNLQRIRELAGSAKVMAVVKADGYGHGLERVARALSSADAFGVAAIADGLRLRAAGYRQRIVVLSGPHEPADLAELRRLDLEAVIHHESQLAWLESEASVGSLRVWLKLDTGMHRLGFPPQKITEIQKRLNSISSVHPDLTVMTHFATSDEFDNPYTARQMACFNVAIKNFTDERSAANSAALLGWHDTRCEWVRVGGLLYGLSVITGKNGSDFGFKPAMTLSTKLISINHVKKGEHIGYAGTWKCPEDMHIGVAAIGYGDGYPRSAVSGTPVLINDKRAPIVGRVSMDLLTIDLRTVPQARVGDSVILWGEELPVEEIADCSGTISYDLTCRVTRRVLFSEQPYN